MKKFKVGLVLIVVLLLPENLLTMNIEERPKMIPERHITIETNTQFEIKLLIDSSAIKIQPFCQKI